MKKKIIGAAATIPVTAGLAMSGACAGGCPYGRTGYCPGRCGHFIDSDGNGNCDLIQTTIQSTTSDSSASDSASSTDISNSAAQNDVNVDTGSTQNLGDIGAETDVNASTVHDSSIFGDNSLDPTNYHAIPLSILIIAGYLFTHFLFSKGILNQRKHRRIWNLLVTVGYIGTGITGIFLILLVNLSIKTILNPSITYLHVELSILMVIGTLIHIHLYKKPFKNMFKVLFGLKSGRKESKKNSTFLE